MLSQRTWLISRKWLVTPETVVKRAAMLSLTHYWQLSNIISPLHWPGHLLIIIKCLTVVLSCYFVAQAIFQKQVLVSFMEIIENWFTVKMSDYCPVKPSQNLKLKRTCEIAWQNFVVCSHRALHSCYKLALTWLLSKYWLVKLETPVIRAAILSQFTGSIGNAYWQPWKNGKDTILMFVFTVQ